MKPMFVLFHHGYCRLCLETYSAGKILNKCKITKLEPNEEGQLDKLSHLTNNSIQKKHSNYNFLKEDSIWTMEKFEAYLKSVQIANSEQIENIYHQIKSILAHCVRSAQSALEKKSGYFQLLGCDILLDENLKPYLLEINSNPAIFTDISAHKEIIPKVVHKVLIIL